MAAQTLDHRSGGVARDLVGRRLDLLFTLPGCCARRLRLPWVRG